MNLPTFTVLMVEDLATDRELYRRSLCQDSTCVYELLEAESVAAGLALCQTRSIDAILLDYALPDGNGLDFLSALSVQSNGRMPPVVMMTGQGNESTAVRAIKLGAEDYVVKGDLTPDLLQLKVQRAIESSRRRQQQQQVELSLQAANEQIKTIWESMTDAYATLDRDWRVVYTNTAAIELYRQTTGLTPAEYLGKSHWELFPATVGTMVEQEYRRSVADQVAVHFELLYEPAETWFEIHAYPSDVGLGIYFQDITERKCEEERLRQSEELKRRILESSRDCIKVVDLAGRLIYMNDYGQSLMEIDDFSTVAGSQWLEFWQGSDRELAQTALSIALAGGVNRFDGFGATAKGTPKWWEVFVTPILDADGRVSQILSVSRDITERKRAERDLLESQERLQTGIEVAGVGLARFDYETNLVALSPEAAVLYGFPADIAFVTREQIHATFHPDERVALEVTIAQVLDPNGMGWFAQDHRVVWPSREVRCLSVRKQVFFDRVGSVPRPSYAILAAIDITDRKQTERKLAESEERLRAGIEVAGVGLARFDYATNLVALSPEAATLYGFAPNKLVVTREQIHATFHPDERAALEVTIAEVIDPNGTGWFAQDHRVVCPSGQVRHLSVRKQVFFDRVGAVPRPNYAILAAIDITLRKQTERALAESEERLRAGIEVAGVGLARFDYATDLVALSPEAATLYGFAPDELVVTREQIHATFHPDERAALEVTIAQVLDPNGMGWFAQDHRVVWPSGQVRHLSVRKQVFFDRVGAVPRPNYAILAAIDVTDRQQTQADLEERNRELDSFVYVVSHDLKAPLRAVSNLSQWIEDDLEGQLTADTQSHMNLLRSRIDRMAATIDGLLEYARIGHSEDTIEPVAMARLLADVIDSVAPPPTFTIDLPTDLPTLFTKRLQLFQVFTNLVGNGIKHHHSKAGTIQILIEERGNFYEFAIADDGSGIAPEHQERMFKIFQAVNPQNRSDSTGIGLAIVKKIIEAEGGDIRLESEIGKGTTFYFTWPKRSGDPST
jgi:PAS domain S-box-containing protein